MGYSSVVVNQAKQLRLQHKSYHEISKLASVPHQTIRNWCYVHQFEYTPTKTNLDLQSIQLITALLYGCEGSKYPASNIMNFVNSEPLLVKKFIDLLRKGFPLNESQFRVHLQLHNTHNVDQVIEYWSKLLAIPITQFIKPTITIPKDTIRRQNYVGTCSLSYLDVTVQKQLLDIYYNFIQQ